MQTYQTHAPDAPGMSDSAHKLKAIQLPAKMDGLRVLDIGSSEGFFCNEIAKRGASRVLGIDLLQKNTDFARATYTDNRIEFRTQGWSNLPDEEFDVILWLSAMHYERDPKSIFHKISKRLATDGLFVLETGVFNIPGRSVKTVSRPGDTLVYPTMDYLTDVLLRDFCPKWMGGGYAVKGDPVPRHVFHCKTAKQTIVIVRGDSRSGKTYLSRKIDCSDKTLQIDQIVNDIIYSANQHSPLEKFIKEHGQTNGGLAHLYRKIDEDGVLSLLFAKWISRMVYASDRLVTIDGDIQYQTLQHIKNELPRAVFWEMERS